MLFISFAQPEKKFTYQIESYKGILWISPSEYTILIFHPYTTDIGRGRLRVLKIWLIFANGNIK